tara:strand:+ start:480 stop:2021 length:1542 start_codon:yes stop_codon:yes gene_type:complete
MMLLFRYRVNTQSNFNFSLGFDNFKLLFNMSSLEVVGARVRLFDLCLSLAVFVCLFIYHQKAYSVKLKISKILTSLASSFVLITFFQRILLNNPFVYFVTSMGDYFFPPKFYSENLVIPKEKGSYVQGNKFNVGKNNLLILTLESFNNDYLNKTTSDGREITPVMNSLYKSKENLSIYPFFANSVQTIKGQFSIYCGRIPLEKGKASYAVNIKKLRCLPDILKSQGLETYFYQTFTDFRFDNTMEFLTDAGFTKVESSEKYLGGLDEFIWGWGLQDDKSYEIFLQNIKNLRKENGGNKPIFASMISLSHHMNFKVPQNLSFLFKHPKSFQERFLNSLHLSDRFLKRFVEIIQEDPFFKDWLIVITGDHSYPSGVNGVTSNEDGFFPEQFSIPFVIMNMGDLKDRVEKDSTFSQVNILPTAIELLNLDGNIEVSNQASIFSENLQKHQIIIQPYDGKRIGFISKNELYSLYTDRKKAYRMNLSSQKVEEVDLKSIQSLYDDYHIKQTQNDRFLR